MRRLFASTLVITGFMISGVAMAQQPTRSVDDYVCTFAGQCEDQEASEGDAADAPATSGRRGRQSQTRGFSLAAPGATGKPATSSSTKNSTRKTTDVKVASKPKPPRDPKPVAAQGQRADLRLSFELGSAQLTQTAMAEAKVFAESLMRPELSSMKFAIEGHTDAQGSREYNLDLSRRRAQAVADYLVGLGVSPERLDVKGYGFDRPLAGRSARSQDNRRVEAVRTS